MIKDRFKGFLYTLNFSFSLYLCDTTNTKNDIRATNPKINKNTSNLTPAEKLHWFQ